jgi:hypothetical protein
LHPGRETRRRGQPVDLHGLDALVLPAHGVSPSASRLPLRCFLSRFSAPLLPVFSTRHYRLYSRVAKQRTKTKEYRQSPPELERCPDQIATWFNV